MTYVLCFFYPAALATAYGQRLKFFRLQRKVKIAPTVPHWWMLLVNLYRKHFKLHNKHTRDFLPQITPAQYFFISAKLNFHRPLVCSTKRNIQYYTPEVRGSSVWQISKKYFAGVIYGQKSLMCQLCSLKRFPINSLLEARLFSLKPVTCPIPN